MKTRLFFKPLAISFCLIIFLAGNNVFSQKYTYEDAWAPEGFSLSRSDASGLEISFSLHEFTMSDFNLNGELMKQIDIQGNFLPNNEGAPDLPGNGRYIAVPNGAEVSFTITAERVERFDNVNVAPAPRIPKVNDSEPLHFEKDKRIFQHDAFYPAQAVQLSEKKIVRGVESVILGITPFQYNPVSKQLLVYRDLKVEINFKGGNNSYGDNRLRSRWFDPILSDIMINYTSLPEAAYPVHSAESLTPDYEYVIICPDDETFISWAEQLALFRNRQGIRTGIFTITDVGGNTTTAIENFVDEAYNSWTVPPVAVLLLGDYGTEGNTIISPVYDNYCVSDNIYADVVNNDDLPDIIFARMTAQNETHLETMITKVINYETNPPVNPDFYDQPITALGWQTDRWFQICAETVGGYFRDVQGKNPVRINAVCDGNPEVDPWSTNVNTYMVLDYFGPDGLGYIPATPQELGGFTGGTAADVEDAVNAGSFMLLHRDHGMVSGWGDPDFGYNNISNLTNNELCYVLSVNCLTGRFDYYSECFAEKFHRHTYNGNNSGALGIIAATQSSYSFVNDCYVWGLYDNLWTDFMPDYGTTPEPRGLLPAFANAAGKYFLEQSNWPYNPTSKDVTYYLFHHHGGAFSTLFSEVPMSLTVMHEDVIVAGLNQFNVTVDEGAFIALSVDGEIIGTGTGTGSETSVTITPQYPPTIIDVVITKTNYYRYEASVQVIPPNGPYVIQNGVIINDEEGNNNGMMDYGESIMLSLEVENVGNEDAENVEISLSSENPNINLIQNQASYGTIPAGETKTIIDAYTFEVSGDIPDLSIVTFDVEATDGSGMWTSNFFLHSHAPVLKITEVSVEDAAGNGNSHLDPGETANLLVSIENSGSADAINVVGDLLANDPFITINSSTAEYGDIMSGDTITQGFNVSTEIICPAGHGIDLDLALSDENGMTGQDNIDLIIGRIPVLILDIEGIPKNSGPHMKSAIQSLGIAVEYSTIWPDDLSTYSSIFVCLGIYNSNHVLENAEGQRLADYLENGGNVYMEGGDTWCYDEPTPVHSMFNIEKQVDGSDDLDSLKGLAGTFTEEMSFAYGGDNEYIDHILPISPANSIFENNFPPYFAAVAHDAEDYKTIGSSFEFGGLINGSGVNTKVELMKEYLKFFGLRAVTASPDRPEGDEEVCANSIGEYTTSAVEQADFYYWSIDPEYAGTVSGTDTVVSIDWDDDFYGLAHISVCGMNTTGLGPVSDSLEINVLKAPDKASSPEGPAIVNTDEEPVTTFSTAGASHASSYQWEVLPVEAYSEILPDGINADISWSGEYKGEVQLKVRGVNDCGEGMYSDDLIVTLENSFGIKEIDKEPALEIYPNPNDGSFILKLMNKDMGKVKLSIINATGVTVYEQAELNINRDHTVTIDISSEANGIYLVIVECNNRSYTSRLMIRK